MKVKFFASLLFCGATLNLNLSAAEQYVILPHGYELDKINSSIEKPGVSFEAIENTISALEKNIDNLGQELKKLKNEVDDIKKIVNSGQGNPKIPVLRTEPVVQPSLITTPTEEIKQSN